MSLRDALPIAQAAVAMPAGCGHAASALAHRCSIVTIRRIWVISGGLVDQQKVMIIDYAMPHLISMGGIYRRRSCLYGNNPFTLPALSGFLGIDWSGLKGRGIPVATCFGEAREGGASQYKTAARRSWSH